MDVGLNYMYTGYVFRTGLPKDDLETKKNEIKAAVEEILVRSVSIEEEISRGSDIDPVPAGEKSLKIETYGVSERWTLDVLRKAAEKIKYISGAKVLVEECRPYIEINGKKFYEDFMDEGRPPIYIFFDIEISASVLCIMTKPLPLKTEGADSFLLV